jgi:mRNA interferase HigB
VNVLAPRTLRAFVERYPESDEPLRDWYNHLRRIEPQHFAELKTHFNSVDAARTKEDLIVFIFDIGGNKYRVVCSINFNSSIAYIKLILTHDEYTQWNKQGRLL